ncbi:MAG: MarR family transcriptional regulator [Candidatus Melainabacteria bacterium HGW-Melainabacteria-1]|nr:MAG: MarR family transcriptional regulator [Candidatus Melainabacteria bacterium HGW-Melainabacteria-1]
MGTHYQGTPEQEQALNAYINFIRAAESLSAQIHQSLSAKGLTESQFGVLEAIFHLGPLCQRALAEKLLKSGGNITLVIDNLEKQQLVERRRNPEDRRYITVSLTQRGQDLIETIFPEHVERITRLLSVLEPSEQQSLRQLCRVLGKQTREPTAAKSSPARIKGASD